MQLDEFLNARSIASLQLLQWLWAAGSGRSVSKSELLRLLRHAMLQPQRARAAFTALDPGHQELLRGLLRLDGYEADLPALLRYLSQPPAGEANQRAFLEDIARRGFIAHWPVRTKSGDTLRVAVPKELGDLLAQALNLDIRDPALMLSLRRYLHTLAPAERARLGLPTAPANQPPRETSETSRVPQAPEGPPQLPGLARPQAIAERIAALPDPAIQTAVRLALEDHAGIVPLERFPSLGLDLDGVDSPRWRAALEEGLLGTFGHLSLRELGLGDDHDCLVVYQELVEAHAAARRVDKSPLGHTYACGIDFLTDLLATVDFLRANPAKLTAAGRFFRGVRNALLSQLALRETFFADEDTLLALRVATARALGLIELRADARAHATRASLDWERLPLVAQARALLEALLSLAETASPVAPAHFRALALVARELLEKSHPGTWLPASAFVARIVSRYLMGLLEKRVSPDSPAPAPPDALGQLPRSQSTVEALVAAAREPLLHALHCGGVLDIARPSTSSGRPAPAQPPRSDQPLVAASPLAPVILGDAPLPSPAAPLLLVNPDFEVILFPEDGHLELLHRLCAFCIRQKSEVTPHLRITRESVQRAVLRGLAADELIATLARHARAPLSQNIEYSIRNWAASVHRAEVTTLHILELPSAQALDTALGLPELAPLVVRRLSPSAVVLSVPQLPTEAEDTLRALGIYLT